MARLALLRCSFVLTSLATQCVAPAADSPAAAPARQLSAADYARAERFLPWNEQKYLLNGNVGPRWIAGQDRFWYRRTDERGGSRFILVDARTGRRTAAFDQARIAAGLS